MIKRVRTFTIRRRSEKLSTNHDNRFSFLFTASTLALIFLMTLTGLAVWKVRDLKTTYSLTEFLATGDNSIKDDMALRKRFKISDSTWMLVVAERNTNWFSKDAIENLANATTSIKDLKGVKSVASLGTLETVVREHGEVRLGKLTDVLSNRDWRKLASESGAVAPVLISNDGRWATMLVELDEMASSDLLATKSLFEKDLSQKLSADRVMVGGVAVLQAELTRVLSREVMTLGGFGAIASVLALMLLFSGWSAIAIAGTTCVAANIIILGTMAATGHGLGVLSISLPIVVAVQTLSLTIHILFSYIELRRTHSRNDALRTSFRRLFLPNLLVSIATGVGFLTLASSNVVAMRDFGITVALASVGLWFITTISIYPLLHFLPEPGLRRLVSGNARWALWLMHYRKSVLKMIGAGVTIVLVAGFITSGLRVNYSHRLFDDLSRTNSSSMAANVVDEKLGGLVPVEVEMVLPNTSWLDPENRVRLNEISNTLRQIPSVGSVISPLDLFKFAGASSEDSASISEVNTLFQLAATNPLRNYLREEGRSARLSVRMRDVPSQDLEAGLKDITRSIASLSPDAQTQLGGWGSYIHRMNRELAQSLIAGFWEALAVIFVLLVVVFRSVRWAAVSLVPSVLPPLLLIACISIFKIQMKPGLAIVFAIALGFAFINTIYLMKRVRDFAESSAAGEVTARVIERAFWHESQSCFMSSLTLLMGFTTLCISEFGVTRSFGMAMVFAMIAGIVGDLILLPALLRQFPGILSSRGSQSLRPVLVAVSIAVITLFSASTRAAGRTPTAEESLESFAKSAAKSLFARDEKVDVELTNVETDGEKEIRRIELSRLTAAGKRTEQKIVARILEPKSLRGTAVLTVTDGESQNRWLYIPSSKQVRRVVGGDESGAPILGSELSTEDLDLSQVDGAKAKIVSRTDGKVVIESRITNKESAYSKCVATFNAKSRLLQTAECADRKGQPFKRITVSGYRALNGSIMRPTEMKIENLKSKRYTKIVFSSQKVNIGLKASQFTPEALKD